MRTICRTLLLCVFTPTLIFAQDPAKAAAPPAQANPLSSFTKTMYGIGAKKIILTAAERMPEEHYSFKPVETVRTFGEILGHIAASQYVFCSAVLGEKNPAPKVDPTKTSKADRIAALHESYNYCSRAYDGMTDAAGAETVKFHNGDTPKLGVLNTNVVHTIEHYGNLVTYMRIKGLVPPTSDPEFMKSVME